VTPIYASGGGSSLLESTLAFALEPVLYMFCFC